MIIRLSTTMLDSYLWGISNDDMTSEELAKELFLGKTQNMAMKCGTAFHALLEHDLNYEVTKEMGFNFLFSEGLDGTLELGDVREQKYVTRIFDDVNLVAKIDAETSSKLIDHKLTAAFDPDKYMDAFQWRAYLLVKQYDNFKYQVFEHSGLDKVVDGLTEVKIKSYHELHQHSYQNMESDVKALVREVADFAKYWKPKLGAAA